MARHKLEASLGLGGHLVKFRNKGVDGGCGVHSPADPQLSSGPVPLFAVCALSFQRSCAGFKREGQASRV